MKHPAQKRKAEREHAEPTPLGWPSAPPCGACDECGVPTEGNICVPCRDALLTEADAHTS